MLFLTYWEVNENMPVAERMSIAQKLTSSGFFPPKGVKILRWDETPDAWGILLMEADNAMDVALALDSWRMAGAGFFKRSLRPGSSNRTKTYAKPGMTAHLAAPRR